MLDSLGLLDATRALPEQLATALDSVPDLEGLPVASDIASVVVFGMGGSGIAGDVLAATARDCTVPIVVVKGYACPSFVGPDTLVLAVSFSGNTEETLTAVSAAVDAGASVVAVCAGGRLAEFAGEVGGWHVPVDDSIPMPRVAIGALSVPLLVTLERIGLVSGATEQIRAAIDQLLRRRAELDADDSPVTRLARTVGRTLPIVYGAGSLGAVAAYRWKCQFNENPKVPAFAGQVPEATHNEICGWGQHGDVTRQVFTLILLRHDHEDPQEARRMELVRELCEEVVADVVEVEASGDGVLAQLFDVVFLGDLMTLRMALDAGVDPGPVPVLDDIKRMLATGSARG